MARGSHQEGTALGVEGLSDIRSDLAEEALRVAARAEADGLSLRLLGGLAIRLRAQDGPPSEFQRDEHADLDWITPKGASAQTQRLFESLGYAQQVRFNAIHGQDRLLFFDEQHGRQVDVFVGAFRMCHEISFGNRLAMEPLTIPLAELLLTKLQIVQLNEKDVRDVLALLHDHPVGDTDSDRINVDRIAKLCSADWGLWRTVTASLETVGGYLAGTGAPEATRRCIADRIEQLQARIEQEPKSLNWKVRAKLGDRKRWYDLPEEVAGGP